MNRLDVQKVHNGLQMDHGLNAIWMSDKSTSSGTFLLGPDGSPLDVGWFDNSIPGKPPGAQNQHAVTAWPEEPRNQNHRVMILQPTGSETGSLVEEDCDMFVDGIDYFPTVLHRESLDPDQLDESVRSLLIGSFVLTTDIGEAHGNMAHSRDHTVADVRESGLAIIEAGDVITAIDEGVLERYADLDPPVLH